MVTRTSTTLLLAIALAANEVSAAICYGRNGYPYSCNRLSTGARIAIGVCVAVGVILIFAGLGCMRRKKLQTQWKQYRPPRPVGNTSNPYAHNPPPPMGAYGRDNYGADMPAPPAQSYQPGTGGQHGLASGYYGNNNNNNSGNLDAHSYEYEQQARMDAAEKGNGADVPPPGYDVSSSNTGTGNSYAPPPGPPPAQSYQPPAGPPPEKS